MNNNSVVGITTLGQKVKDLAEAKRREAERLLSDARDLEDTAKRIPESLYSLAVAEHGNSIHTYTSHDGEPALSITLDWLPAMLPTILDRLDVDSKNAIDYRKYGYLLWEFRPKIGSIRSLKVTKNIKRKCHKARVVTTYSWCGDIPDDIEVVEMLETTEKE